MVNPLRLLRSWHKEEARGPQRWLLWTGLLGLVISPLLALHLFNRSDGLMQQQAMAREDALALLETSLAENERDAWDWGHWDDAYRFALGHNPDYVHRNLETAALFNTGAVMLMLRPDGSLLLNHSKPRLDPATSAALLGCLHDNLSAINSKRSSIRLACRTGRGPMFLGAATPITNNALNSQAAGTLALLQPLPRHNDTPGVRRHLQGLQQQLRWLPPTTGPDGAIQPPIRATSGLVVGLERPNRTAMLRKALQDDLPILLTIPLVAVLLRGFSLLERRRQRLRERQVEREANQRLRRTCRELDGLIDELLPVARGSSNAAMASGPSSGVVEATTARFRGFLQSARRLALFDSLTQLPNRHYFIDQLSNVAAEQRRQQRHFAILFIDIDKFKIINDSYGHAIGDAVLLEVCQRLANLLGRSDFLARYGGDELAVILDPEPLPDQAPEAISAAARSRALLMANALQEAVVVHELSIPVSLSIGITLVTPDDHDLAAVIQRSDLAMYQAKRNRTNRIVGPGDLVQIPQLSSYQLFTDLMEAIHNQQLQIFFQPIRTSNGSTIGVEALARWQHPQRGWIEPAVFLDVAEQHRQMQSLGDALIRLSLDGFEHLQREQPKLRLFLNLAPSQLCEPQLAHALLESLRSRDLEGQQLVLELTETTLLEPLPAVLHNLEQLRAAGISLALDDFGTGYSSLVMLKSLSPDIVKIDKTFIQAMGNDSRALHIISLIAELAPRLGLDLVAEGIEDRATMQHLINLGIERFQGYELGRPAPVSDLLQSAAQGASDQPASNRSMV